MTSQPGPALPKRLMGLALLGAIAYGIVYVGQKGCQAHEDIQATGARFLAALRRGDVQAAYGELSNHRQRRMSLDDFASLTDHPAYRAHEKAVVGKHKSRPDGTCTLGDLIVDGKEWAVQLYFVEEGDRHRVESFGIQAPADMQLGVLLEECGYWSGTLVGYSGPPVERSTKPVDD